jgi:hypothetical protein
MGSRLGVAYARRGPNLGALARGGAGVAGGRGHVGHGSFWYRTL